MHAIANLIPGDKHRTIYELIRRKHTVSKVQLLELTNWSLSTMTRTLEELCEQKLILESGFGESTGGRRPILYTVNPDFAYVLGLEISRTNSMLILCNMNLDKLAFKRWEMSPAMTPQVLVNTVVSAVKEMLDSLTIPSSSVVGLGVGAVGPLDRMAGIIINPLYFPAEGWNRIPIQEMLESRLSIPVVLDNGANMAVLGEHWSSREESRRHLLYIHAGVGLRSAVMTDGKIVYGAADIEDSIGHMVIQSDGPRLGPEGNYGSLENYATIHALEQQARAKIKQGRESRILQALEPDNIQFPQLLQALKEGDPLVAELFAQSAAYFGIGLANVINILHPEKVILGGPLLNADPMFFDISTKVAIRNTHSASLYEVQFSMGNLGEDAIVIGSAASVVNQVTGIMS